MKTNVDKSNFEVFEFIGGYYGICEVGKIGANCVFGGDSACEDHYNKEYIEDVYLAWNGDLDEYGNIYL